MKPLECFEDVIRRARELVVLHQHLNDDLALLSTRPQCDTVQVRDDVLRSALVLAIAALDRYMHERVSRQIVRAFRRPTRLNRRQREFTVPAYVAFEVARKAAHNVRVNLQDKTGPRPVRPANLVRNAIRGLMHERPLQSWRQIEDAMGLIGITNTETQLRHLLHDDHWHTLKSELATACRMRNLIVHEGHIKRRLRGHSISHGEISVSAVNRAIDCVTAFVRALEQVR